MVVALHVYQYNRDVLVDDNRLPSHHSEETLNHLDSSTRDDMVEGRDVLEASHHNRTHGLLHVDEEDEEDEDEEDEMEENGQVQHYQDKMPHWIH